MSDNLPTPLRWYGRVIDTNDPTKTGLVKVRIYGVHSDNVSEAPSDQLPWAMTINSSNSSKSFSSLTEGDFVTGYYPGSLALQPIIDGTVNGLMGAITSLGGFKPDSLNPIKTDMPNGLPPKNQPGKPTLGPAARGDVANTNISKTNSMLDHSCDFRYFINLPTITIGLNNPITEIQEAIRQGKNRSAKLMSLLLTQMNTYLRQIINGLLPALGLDPSGIASKSYSVAKDIVRQINALTKKVAMIAETASFYYNLVRDIQQIVEYLKSLPDRIMAIIQGCIDQFLGSLKNFVDMLKSIPGMFSSDMENMLNQLSGATQTALETANTSGEVTNTPSSNNDISSLISITLYQTDADHANIIMDFINTNYANASVTLANATANSFSKSSMQSP